MNGYSLDTNIVAAYLKRNPLVMRRMRQAEIQGYPVRLNAVSYYETKRGLLFAGAQKQLAVFERLWQGQGVVMLDQRGLDKAAELYVDLRATGQLIEDADLLMAAIALVQDVTLVTHNTAHLSRVVGLRLEDWLSS